MGSPTLWLEPADIKFMNVNWSSEDDTQIQDELLTRSHMQKRHAKRRGGRMCGRLSGSKTFMYAGKLFISVASHRLLR